MNKRERLQLLITGKTPKIIEGFKAFDSGVAELKKNLEETIRISTLDEVSTKINEVKKKVDLTPIVESIHNLKAEIEANDAQEKKELEVRLFTLKKDIITGDTNNLRSVEEIHNEIDTIQRQISEILSRKPIEIPDFTPQIIKTENKLRELIAKIQSDDEISDKTIQENIDELESELKVTRLELLNKINNRGGGRMNRQVLFNSTNYLGKYTDYNLIAGANTTFTITEDSTHKRVNLTISSSGTGGSGITRVITSFAVPTNAASATDTDYVYLGTGSTPLTMPTAAGNDNLYTIKNVGSGTIAINFTGVETGDGSTQILLPVQYTSVDLISDGTNWNVT